MNIKIIGIIAIVLLVGLASGERGEGIDVSYTQTYAAGLNASEIMAIIAMFSAFAYHFTGYLYRKKQDNTISYDPAHLSNTVITIMLSGISVINMHIPELCLEGVLVAVILGLGGNAAMSKVKK